ncbi:MAG: hypothetical protein HY059_01785 [Proteobacteria bacterium]|nr:hypothetical protein [Pseudomonadota bacterium]
MTRTRALCAGTDVAPDARAAPGLLGRFRMHLRRMLAPRKVVPDAGLAMLVSIDPADLSEEGRRARAEVLRTLRAPDTSRG